MSTGVSVIVNFLYIVHNLFDTISLDTNTSHRSSFFWSTRLQAKRPTPTTKRPINHVGPFVRTRCRSRNQRSARRQQDWRVVVVVGRWKNNNSQLKNGYTSPLSLRRERKDNNTIYMQNKEFECMYISIYLPINLLSLAT